jgi:hypothetical protein
MVVADEYSGKPPVTTGNYTTHLAYNFTNTRASLRCGFAPPGAGRTVIYSNALTYIPHPLSFLVKRVPKTHPDPCVKQEAP